MSYCWRGYTPLITAVLLLFIISTVFVIGMAVLYILLSLSIIGHEYYNLDVDGHVLKSLDANLDCAMACKYVAFYKGWNQLSPDVPKKEERKPKTTEKKEFARKEERKPENIDKKVFGRKEERKPQKVDKKEFIKKEERKYENAEKKAVTLIDEELPEHVQDDDYELRTGDLVKDSEKLDPKELLNEPIPKYDEDEDSQIFHINKKRKVWYCPPT